MARLLFVQHLASSHAGWVGEWAAQRRHTVQLCRPLLDEALPLVGAHDATVIFGGPMGANDACPFLDRERAWLTQALQTRQRLFGICLGAQLLAKLLGATVGPRADGQVECGYTWVDPADAPDWLDAPQPVYHWHEDGFTLPEGARLLARGRGAFPVQGFVRERAVAVQFHPEATDAILERWLTRDQKDLCRPGAQAPAAHWENHRAYTVANVAWLFRTLDRWVGLP
jgi:GMP synthase (glutamine-hydrolysing)